MPRDFLPEYHSRKSLDDYPIRYAKKPEKSNYDSLLDLDACPTQKIKRIKETEVLDYGF